MTSAAACGATFLSATRRALCVCGPQPFGHDAQALRALRDPPLRSMRPCSSAQIEPAAAAVGGDGRRSSAVLVHIDFGVRTAEEVEDLAIQVPTEELVLPEASLYAVVAGVLLPIWVVEEARHLEHGASGPPSRQISD